ncbi:alpha/beta hydrolase fold protein [Ancylobacter novellus DSM 506]|uniref:Alpha/beta hydrolase fold protein n=1 Tax=Ancylobacter novellus (strain ATCC 8093 / DSM 506 / JCM 20403 / CCM 1077 / IAM 12100 / NBRC 12443 / NCIMB 10456) TaxID=639283 RepID=D7AA13_ANCN5|nr:alpha/beta hydrolase [Ancylobacter novellus]ADH90800.1 alpha/beta hydrolase fold protein [Ancylobacter novellus DSM 506]
MAELLNHRLTGEKRDFALLLIHPLGADLSIWDDFVAALDGRVTTLAMDLPGSGGSPGPGRPVGLAEQAEALEALRGALGIEKLCPIGIAVGAMTAATYAATHPARTSALILTNPTPASAPQARQMLADRAEAVRQGGIAAVLPGAVDRSFLEMPRDARYERYMNRFSAQDPEAYALAVLAAAEADASTALRAIDSPTLLVPGRHDVLLPMERTEAVAKLVPHARIAVMEHAAHFVPYQQPAAFAALVLDFLGREAALA